jgi:hypothetical protein
MTWVDAPFQGWPAYNEKANAAGAQTERRGEAWAGAGLAWRQNRTGRFSSQKLLVPSRDRQGAVRRSPRADARGPDG